MKLKYKLNPLMTYLLSQIIHMYPKLTIKSISTQKVQQSSNIVISIEDWPRLINFLRLANKLTFVMIPIVVGITVEEKCL